MSAILGRKVGMTSVSDDSGRQTVVTVIEAGPCAVTQVKTPETDGYSAVQIGYQNKKAKHTTKALAGHFEAAGVEPKRHVVEFRDLDLDVTLGDEITVGQFEEGDVVAVSGTSAPGSIGQASSPSRVFKGTKMAGRTGGERVTLKNVRVVRTFPDNNLILVKGAVPGHKNGIVEIRKA